MSKAIISVDVKEFAAAVNWAGRGVGKGSSVQEAAVALSLEGDRLTLEAFDGSGHFESSLQVTRDPSDEGEDVSLAIHGSILTNTAKIIRSDEAKLEFSKTKVVVRSGRSHYSMPALRAITITQPPLAKSIGSISAPELRNAVNKASVAASTDETLAGLTGLLIEFKAGSDTFRIVGCDRYQLAIAHLEFSPNASNPITEDFEVLIPARELKKLVAGLDQAAFAEIHASKDSRFFGIKSAQDGGYVNVFDEKFVPYQKLTEIAYQNRMVVNRNELKRAVSDIMVLAGAQEAIYLELQPDLITVRNKANDSEVEVDAEVTGETGETFSFSREYLNGALNSTTTSNVSFEYGPPRKPLIVRNVDDNGEDISAWYHLILPRTT